MEVSYSEGRLVPKDTVYDPKTNRGINIHENCLMQFLAIHCGFGQEIDFGGGQTFVVNKASCFKLLNPTVKEVDKSSPEFQNFIALDPQEVAKQVKTAFGQLKATAIFTGKVRKHLVDLLGKGVIEKLPICNPTTFDDPREYPASVMKGLWQGTPFIALKVTPANPDQYFEQTEKKRVEKLFSDTEARLDAKQEWLKEPHQHLIILRKIDEDTLWMNLGFIDKYAPQLINGRSTEYNVKNPPQEIGNIKNFLSSVVSGQSAIDFQGKEWKLAPS